MPYFTINLLSNVEHNRKSLNSLAPLALIECKQIVPINNDCMVVSIHLLEADFHKHLDANSPIYSMFFKTNLTEVYYVKQHCANLVSNVAEVDIYVDLVTARFKVIGDRCRLLVPGVLRLHLPTLQAIYGLNRMFVCQHMVLFVGDNVVDLYAHVEYQENVFDHNSFINGFFLSDNGQMDTNNSIVSNVHQSEYIIFHVDGPKRNLLAVLAGNPTSIPFQINMKPLKQCAKQVLLSLVMNECTEQHRKLIVEDSNSRQLRFGPQTQVIVCSLDKEYFLFQGGTVFLNNLVYFNNVRCADNLSGSKIFPVNNGTHLLYFNGHQLVLQEVATSFPLKQPSLMANDANQAEMSKATVDGSMLDTTSKFKSNLLPESSINPRMSLKAGSGIFLKKYVDPVEDINTVCLQKLDSIDAKVKFENSDNSKFRSIDSLNFDQFNTKGPTLTEDVFCKKVVINKSLINLKKNNQPIEESDEDYHRIMFRMTIQKDLKENIPNVQRNKYQLKKRMKMKDHGEIDLNAKSNTSTKQQNVLSNNQLEANCVRSANVDIVKGQQNKQDATKVDCSDSIRNQNNHSFDSSSIQMKIGVCDSSPDNVNIDPTANRDNHKNAKIFLNKKNLTVGRVESRCYKTINMIGANQSKSENNSSQLELKQFRKICLHRLNDLRFQVKDSDLAYSVCRLCPKTKNSEQRLTYCNVPLDSEFCDLNCANFFGKILVDNKWETSECSYIIYYSNQNVMMKPVGLLTGSVGWTPPPSLYFANITNPSGKLDIRVRQEQYECSETVSITGNIDRITIVNVGEAVTRIYGQIGNGLVVNSGGQVQLAGKLVVYNISSQLKKSNATNIPVVGGLCHVCVLWGRLNLYVTDHDLVMIHNTFVDNFTIKRDFIRNII